MTELETRTVTKITWRLVPFLMLCYFVAFLDRVNVGFAHNQMIESLGMSEAAFGLGAGIFFIAYFLLEVPSNIWLEKFGARLWIARIMLTWGMVSAAFAWIPQIAHYTGLSNNWVFYILRFLLGISEAGFYPGVIFYLTMWFPKAYRARVVGMFMLAIPFSGIIGAPISGALLNVTGLGMEGWQWLFFLEAVPSIILGFIVFYFLTDFPYDAKWLKQDEIGWLVARLHQESLTKGHDGHSGFVKMMLNPAVLLLCFIYFLYQAAGYSLSLFLPQIVAKMGYGNLQTGLILAIPPAIGAIGMTLMCRSSDRHRERKLHLAVSLSLLAIGLMGGALATDAMVRIAFFSVANIGGLAFTPIFWTIPPNLLPKEALAAGIAAVNSLGSLGGFFGPTIFGYVKSVTGTPVTSLLVMVSFSAVAAALALTVSVRQENPAVDHAVEVAAH